MTGDPRFFANAGPHAPAAVAEAAGGALRPAAGGAAPAVLRGIAPLQSAGPEDCSFLDNRRYLDALRATRAGAVILHPDMANEAPGNCLAIVTERPYRGWARVAALFHPPPPVRPGIHPSAVVEAGAACDPSAEIGAFAHVGAGARIGADCRIGPHACVGPGVELGPGCRIGAHAGISHAILGARVMVHPGARIGQDGFGFDPEPGEHGFLSVPQLGLVLIGDDVSVGANTTIDRGSAGDTVIGHGCRLDNLVQIGHNVRLGRCCVVVSQAGISGSTVLGDFVTVAGQAGLIGHLRIGDRARIGAQAGVMADVAGGLDILGSPAQPIRQFLRETATLRRMARAAKPHRP